MSRSRDAHLPPRTLRDYRRGRLAPAETLAAADHLAACPACRDALATLDDGASSPLPDNVWVPPSGTAWWRRHEALLQTTAAVAAVLLMTAIWWRVSGSKPALEDQLLTDARGRSADLSPLPADLRDAVARTLREGRVPRADLPATLRPPGGVLAGPTAGTRTPFLATQPVGAVVRGRQPTLRWTARAEATGYVVTLGQLGDHAPPAPVSPELPATQTEWTPPEPLTAGAVYAWQVEARRGTGTLDRTPQPPAAEARFLVLDDARRAELDRVEREFADFPLVTAVALARAGLTEATAGQLDKLAREHPQSAAAQRLQRGAAASADRGRGRER